MTAVKAFSDNWDSFFRTAIIANLTTLKL